MFVHTCKYLVSFETNAGGECGDILVSIQFIRAASRCVYRLPLFFYSMIWMRSSNLSLEMFACGLCECWLEQHGVGWWYGELVWSSPHGSHPRSTRGLDSRILQWQQSSVNSYSHMFVYIYIYIMCWRPACKLGFRGMWNHLLECSRHRVPKGGHFSLFFPFCFCFWGCCCCWRWMKRRL